MTYNYIFKIIVVGNNNVGKSSIIRTFEDGFYDSTYHSTIGIDFSIKILQLENTCVKLQIWDTAGSERFRSIVNNYYRDCIGIFIVFDKTNRKSFESVTSWYENALEHVTHTPEELTFVLVGNKNDLQPQQVSEAEIEELAKNLNMTYFDASAQTRYNIDEMFMNMAEKIYEKVENNIVFLEPEHKKITPFHIVDRSPSISSVSLKRHMGKCCVII